MLDFLWHSTAAWLGIGGFAIVGLAVAAWLIPGFRMLALKIGGGILAAGALMAKGAHDQKLREEKRKEEAVGKAKADYAKIDARPDTADTVVDRLRRNDF